MPRVSVSLKDEELQELSRRANVAQLPLSTYLARVAREHITQIWDPLLELGAQVTTAREYRSRYKICCCGLDSKGRPAKPIPQRETSTDYIALTHVEPRGSNVLDESDAHAAEREGDQ